jgi:hypothetical protein
MNKSDNHPLPKSDLQLCPNENRCCRKTDTKVIRVETEETKRMQVMKPDDKSK